jgi:peptidyl-prolyl cis-trans isomerase SurA
MTITSLPRLLCLAAAIGFSLPQVPAQTVAVVPDSDIDKAIAEEIAMRFEGDRAKFLNYLKKQEKTVRDYRHEVGEKIKNGELLKPAGEVRLRVIQISRREGETDEKLIERTNQAILAPLQGGDLFGDLAKKYSEDKRALNGGDWGWLKSSHMKKTFSDAAFRLKKGEASPVIVVPEGAFVLFVEDRR